MHSRSWRVGSMTRRVAACLRLSVTLVVSALVLSPVSATDLSTSSVDMVTVPAGEFLMGSPIGSDGFPDEAPLRRVWLSSFRLDRFEVTNEAYARFVHETGHRIPENTRPQATLWTDWHAIVAIARHPVVNVSWEDAVAFCRWRGARLPTEAEWEKAARGPNGRIYPWGDEWDRMKANSASYWAERTLHFDSGAEWEAFWITGDGARIAREKGIRGEVLTMPVGSFPDGVSPYGIHDLAGNVAEWVADWHDPNYYRSAPLHDPPGSTRGAVKAMRGGSWLKPFKSLRGADRDWGLMDSRPSGTGFRCAHDAY
ncbi:MAG: SUMF1/EgtB/PvdO family nonheme iron enzyme [Nitrospiraceae bacterium]